MEIISKSFGLMTEKTLNGVQVKDIDTVKGIVIIYINAFNVKDSDGDISIPGSFKKTFRENLKITQHWLNHERNLMLGFPLQLKEDDIGAIAVSQMNIKKQLSLDVFEDYRILAENERTLQHSVRVWPIKFEEDRNGDEYTRHVTEWRLIMEYSTVYGWGANQQTPLIEIKNRLSDLEIMMNNGNYSDEKALIIEETYNKLKKLLNEPQTTQEPEPVALREKQIKHFYSQLKI